MSSKVSVKLDFSMKLELENSYKSFYFCQATGTGTWDLGLGTWDLGPGTWDLGPGTWDLGPGTWDLGPRT